MSELINFLKQADIFYHFTTTQLEMVANLCKECTYGKGETILEESSNSKDLYIILQGEVDVLVNPALVGGPEAAQGEVIITTLCRGQSFGEVALVDEGVRSATCRATQENTRLLAIPREKLIALFEIYPSLGYRLMYNLAADLAMKIRNNDLRIRNSLLYSRPDK
jgi:CRP/FNR family cyclic AMP-dependent transcriptional regulator